MYLRGGQLCSSKWQTVPEGGGDKWFWGAIILAALVSVLLPQAVLSASPHSQAQLQVSDWLHPTAGAIRCFPYITPWISSPGKLTVKPVQLDVRFSPGWQRPPQGCWLLCAIPEHKSLSSWGFGAVQGLVCLYDAFIVRTRTHIRLRGQPWLSYNFVSKSMNKNEFIFVVRASIVFIIFSNSYWDFFPGVVLST